MREAVGHDITLRLLLQGIVADRGGGVKRVLDIALLEDLEALIGICGPDAGEAIGLQLDADAQRTCSPFESRSPTRFCAASTFGSVPSTFWM